jgi:hypothetical protein
VFKRRDRIEELLLLKLGDPVVRVLPIFGRLDVGELRLVDTGELLELAGLAIKRLEDLCDLELFHAGREERLERIEGRLVLGACDQDVLVREDRTI